MTSIGYNSGAAVALRMLGGTVQKREEVQDDISTGKEVDSAKDAAALWAISQVMESDSLGFTAISDSLSLGEATATVAAVGAEQIGEILVSMKELAITASSGPTDYSRIEEQMALKTKQIGSIISAAQFNGANLLRTSIDGNGNTSLTVAASLDRSGTGPASLSTLSVASVDFEASPSFDLSNRTTITDQASARTALTEIQGFLDYAINGAYALGSSANRLSEQEDFITQLSDTMTRGISSMINTDMEEASAVLAAKKIQEQLGAMSLSIANTNPQRLLGLF